MRTPVIAGNWKMNSSLAEAWALATQVKANCQFDGVEMIVCPPFTALSSVAQVMRGSRIGVGGQDLFWEPMGAFTGEISPAMLVDAGCRYVILGHSERRTLFGETDDMVRRKLAAALQHPLTPIVCIGETLEEREAGRTFEVLTRQLEGAFGRGAPEDASRKSIVAYEPVWAIGTGRTATPEQAQEAHAFIRQWFAKSAGPEVASAIRLQYGGSVNAENAASLLVQADVDGALVGGASLKADAFTAIVKAALQPKAMVS